MTGQPKPKAYSYVRFSTPDQAAGDSLRRQTEAARRYAAHHGLELDEALTFRDLGVSAHHGRNAEVGALAAFLAAVRDGQVPQGSYLLIESLDRISRQVVRKAVRTLEDITEAGVVVVDLSDGGRAYSPEILDQDQFAYIMMALRFIRANEESATKGMRVGAAYDRKRAKAASREQASAPFTRQLPAWLAWSDEAKSHALIPERAKIILEMFEKADQGWGQHKIAHEFNRRGEKPWGDAEYWHRSYVRKVLTNPAVVGTFTPNKTVKGEGGRRRRKPLDPIPNYWPAAIDEALFERVNARMAAPAARGRHSGKTVHSIFAGVARCALCGRAIIRASKGEHVYLVCAAAHARAGCRYLAVRYRDVERALLESAARLVDSAPGGKGTEEIDKTLQSLEYVLWEMEQDAAALVDELAVTRSDAVRRKLRELEVEIAKNSDEARRLRAQKDAISGPHVARRMERLLAALTATPIEVESANRVLKEALDRIVVDPEKGSLAVHWRQGGEPQFVNFYSRHFNEFAAA